jgi:signal transduction histidine kinase
MSALPTPRDESMILIVDDNDLRRYTKGRILRNAGYEVIEAGSGTEGLLLVQDKRPRLAIVDVGLPDMSGHEVCRRIKAETSTSSLPVLQVSATFVTDGDTVLSLDSGADASLIEPIEPPVLVATVRALLRTRQADDAMREALAREQAARTAAEEANRVKDEFLAVLSHELRSPLAAILSWATLLRGGTLDEARREQGLEAIERNANLQRKLIEDLLDVSRIISGKSMLELGRVDLGPAINAAIESIRSAADAKGIEIVSTVDPQVVPLRADATRLHQVIWNLLSNAVKFTPRGGRVHIEVAQSGSDAVIRVSDTGVGISPQFIPHVFERFRQADSSTTRAEGGLGLGLSIVRHIVELHGGSVVADSGGDGRGAEFTVRLPLPPASAGDGHAAGAGKGAGRAGSVGRGSGDGAAGGARLDGVHVLIVEDDPDAREALAAILGARGADVTATDSVAAAKRELEANGFDVVLSDIGMPSEDGYSFIRQLREHEAWRAMPALALSAYANSAEVRRTREAGFDATLAKPVDAERLVAEVARLVKAGSAK